MPSQLILCTGDEGPSALQGRKALQCCPNYAEIGGMEWALPPALRKGSAFPAHLPRFSPHPRRREGYAFGGADEVGA